MSDQRGKTISNFDWERARVQQILDSEAFQCRRSRSNSTWACSCGNGDEAQLLVDGDRSFPAQHCDIL